MKSHDTRHTGRNPYSTANNPLVKKWRFYSSSWIDSGIPIDNDGVIYFRGAYDYIDRYLFAVYPDGSLKWKIQLTGWVWSTPAIGDDGTIYVGPFAVVEILLLVQPQLFLQWALVKKS